MDWSNCTDVERKPDTMQGAFVVIGTRVPADSVIEHERDGYTAEDIATEIFPSVSLSRARRIIAFAHRHDVHPGHDAHPTG